MNCDGDLRRFPRRAARGERGSRPLECGNRTTTVNRRPVNKKKREPRRFERKAGQPKGGRHADPPKPPEPDPDIPSESDDEDEDGRPEGPGNARKPKVITPRIPIANLCPAPGVDLTELMVAFPVLERVTPADATPEDTLFIGGRREGHMTYWERRRRVKGFLARYQIPAFDMTIDPDVFVVINDPRPTIYTLGALGEYAEQLEKRPHTAITGCSQAGMFLHFHVQVDEPDAPVYIFDPSLICKACLVSLVQTNPIYVLKTLDVSNYPWYWFNVRTVRGTFKYDKLYYAFMPYRADWQVVKPLTSLPLMAVPRVGPLELFNLPSGQVEMARGDFNQLALIAMDRYKQGKDPLQEMIRKAVSLELNLTLEDVGCLATIATDRSLALMPFLTRQLYRLKQMAWIFFLAFNFILWALIRRL